LGESGNEIRFSATYSRESVGYFQGNIFWGKIEEGDDGGDEYDD
jgi:hypothetical protein